jgi:hypothetical protein
MVFFLRASTRRRMASLAQPTLGEPSSAYQGALYTFGLTGYGVNTPAHEAGPFLPATPFPGYRGHSLPRKKQPDHSSKGVSERLAPRGCMASYAPVPTDFGSLAQRGIQHPQMTQGAHQRIRKIINMNADSSSKRCRGGSRIRCTGRAMLDMHSSMYTY